MEIVRYRTRLALAEIYDDDGSVDGVYITGVNGRFSKSAKDATEVQVVTVTSLSHKDLRDVVNFMIFNMGYRDLREVVNTLLYDYPIPVQRLDKVRTIESAEQIEKAKEKKNNRLQRKERSERIVGVPKEWSTPAKSDEPEPYYIKKDLR